jgi:hypothetical protein
MKDIFAFKVYFKVQLDAKSHDSSLIFIFTNLSIIGQSPPKVSPLFSFRQLRAVPEFAVA